MISFRMKSNGFNCMCYAVILLCAIAFRAVNSTSNIDNKVEEVCLSETMRGRCRWNSEVIVVTSARWGRMKTGRCLEVHPNFMATHGQDPLYLGCSENVLALMDRKCSGRSECDIRIPDPELDGIKPCYRELIYYLEISYTCVPVVQDTRSCLVTVTNEHQFISSSSSFSDTSPVSSCGTKSHPWHLEAPVGQRINISLLDFSDHVNAPTGRDVRCRQYGYILEKPNKKNASICAAAETRETKHREMAVFMSDTNTLDIVLVAGAKVDNHSFLIKLEAIGCTNMIPPDNAWLKRSNNDIVIGCYLSQQTWQLKCEGHEWKGQIGTCPEFYQGRIENEVEPAAESREDLFVTGTMAIIIAAALIICCTVVSIGCYCVRRQQRTVQKKMNANAKDANYERKSCLDSVESADRNGLAPHDCVQVWHQENQRQL